MKSKKCHWLSLVVLIIYAVGCASDKVRDANSSYPVKSLSDDSKSVHRTDKPLALNPSLRDKIDNSGVLAAASVGGFAGIALLGLLAGRSATMPLSPQYGPELYGRCVYGEPSNPISSPCVNITVNLLGNEKEVLATASTDRHGDFRFYIPQGQTYYVQVIDRKGRSSSTSIKVGRSQFISLYLKP